MCAYAHVSVLTYICIYIYMYTYIYIHTHMFIHIVMCTYMFPGRIEFGQIDPSQSAFICPHICIYVTYFSINRHMYVYISI